MAHNHLMSNQQLTMNPGVSVAATQQPSVMSQRGPASASPKSSYQMQSVAMSHLSHLQQQHSQQPQAQLGNSYHNHKQMPSGIFSPVIGSVPTQNGSYQTMSGSSLRGLDNSQLSMSHQTSQHHQYQQPQHQPPIQPPVQQHHYQPPQSIAKPQQQPQQPQQQGQQPQQQGQQPQQQHIFKSVQQQQQHVQQVPHKPTYQQQHLQILQQRSPQHQHKYQKQHELQPKQILQHSPPTQKTSSRMQLDNCVVQEQPKSGVVMNGHHAAAAHQKDNCLQAEDKSGHESPQETTNNATEKPCLANTKEKTPMCLINELARFNKILHQYTLVDEQGPAHKKTFYVKLKLAEEEYSAAGDSIKKAQHTAASIALEKSKYPQPPPKPARFSGSSSTGSGVEHMTPTVELNALAMKRGESAVYKSIEPQQPPFYHNHGMDFRGFYGQRYHQQHPRAHREPHYYGTGVLWPLRYHYPRMNRAFYVSLRLGHREFIGDGPTRQAARHNAAQKALRILKNLPVQDDVQKDEERATVETDETADSLKSEISLVHEIALRRNMCVSFEVIREAGPPHMKNFITKCTVADMVTEGEGNSKKSSKKKAAELMLQELRKLHPAPAPACPKPKTKMQLNKKKNRNLIKSELQQQKADPNYGVGINPISRLIQIMQAQKRKEPVYTLVAERGLPRRREFVMQVEVEDKSCTGTGPNKKLAKRAAAECMLQFLGYTKPSPQPVKSSFKHPASGENNHNGDKKVTFVEGDAPPENMDMTSSLPLPPVGLQRVPGPLPPVGPQRVPGLLHIPNSSKPAVMSGAATSPQPQPKESLSLVNLAGILKPNLRPELQLRKLCKALGYAMEVDDFTKKRPEGTEHIVRITISQGQEQQSFHGSSNTVDASRDAAALDALKALLANTKDVHPGGDGPQMKKEQLISASSGLKTDVCK
ncbi:hypothetical protein BsWGS_24611 [Bradybaena similaris]